MAANDHEDDVDNLVHFRWLIHFSDRDPVEVTFSPAATHGEVLERHPSAVAAVPVGKEFKRRAPTPDEVAQLRELVQAVYRDDSDDDRYEALQWALADVDDALACYKAIASERGLTPAVADDRRTCRECANLSFSGACSVAAPGGTLSAQEGYRPGALWQEQPHRCEAFNERGAT